MRIDNPLWPVVRETSRLILRGEQLVIHLPERHLEALRQLILEMSDYQPAKIDYPEYISSELNAIDVFQMRRDSNEFEHLAHVSLNEPKLTVRWVKMDVDEGWKHILESCKDLHEAGYPGCIGCGGPNSELPWDEPKNRLRLTL